MLNKISSTAIAGIMGLSMVATANASDLFVVHGINGDDLGLDEALPVDISVDGGCALTDVSFRAIAGPIPFDPGQYDIEVRLSDGACGGLLAIKKTIDVQFGENSAVVAHLTEQGTPTLSKFVNDVRLTNDDHDARAIVRHAAAAPPVDVKLRRDDDKAELLDIRNTEQRAAEIPAGDWHVTIKPFGEEKTDPIPVTLEAMAATIVYAVGSLKNGTLEPLPQVLFPTP